MTMAALLTQRLEPGGWGAFMLLERDPQAPASWIAGSDVGGLFVSDDDGSTWTQCLSPALLPATNWFLDIVFTADGTPVLGSTAGIYRGLRREGDHCGKWTFTNSSTGLVPGNYSELLSSSGFAFLHSVNTLAAAREGETVWAGIGQQDNLGALKRFRRGDPWHVYRSGDGGQTWSPKLTLPAVGTVQSIAVASDGAAYVATAAGLFGSRDEGVTWMRIGELGPPRCTYDHGHSWSGCASSSPSSPWPPCASASSCLPVASAANESSPNLRTVVAAGSELFVAVWDSNTWPDELPDCRQAGGRPSVRDPNLKYFRGGPWRSTDGGRSWTYLFLGTATAGGQSGPLMRNASLRCPGSSPAYLGSQWPSLRVDPYDTTHAMLGGWAQGEGLYELRGAGRAGAEVLEWNRCAGDADTYGCYEGRRPDSYAADHNTYFFAFRVDWTSNETRVISGGIVRSNSSSSPSYTTPPLLASRRPHGGGGARKRSQHPLVWATTSRGGLRAAWDPLHTRYSFKHFNNDLVDETSVPPTWRSTGLGDTCAWGAAWSDGGAVLLLAVADGGVARTRDGGSSWQRVSENWPAQLNSQGTAIIADDQTDCVLAAHSDRGGTNLASVLKTCDGGDTWSVIGGFMFSPTDPDARNGLSTDQPLRSLAVWTAASRVLAGGGGGIFEFEPQRAQGTQWRPVELPSNASCQIHYAAAGPVVSQDAPHLAVVACGTAGLFVGDARQSPDAAGGSTTWKPLELHGTFPRSATAIALWGWQQDDTARGGATLTARIALGGDSADGTPGPRLYHGACVLTQSRAVGQLQTCGSCNVSLSSSPLDHPSAPVSRMHIASLLAAPPRVLAGLSVGDYFDYYPPPALYVSEDGAGAAYFAEPVGGANSTGVTNANIVSLVREPHTGRICAATNGDALQCFNMKTRPSPYLSPHH
jgi:photosystem II stability/assembly factor-like uncharacterized protein